MIDERLLSKAIYPEHENFKYPLEIIDNFEHSCNLCDIKQWIIIILLYLDIFACKESSIPVTTAEGTRQSSSTRLF